MSALINWVNVQPFLLYFSALLYSVPLLFPYCFWWVTFLVPPFFLYSVRTIKPTFFKGFIWGALVVLGYSSSFLVGIFSLLRSAYVYRCIVVCVIVCILAAWSGIWFWGMHYMLPTQTHKYGKIWLWGVTLWVYLCWMEYGCLVVCGRFEGVCIANLLVPLIQCPSLLYFAPTIGVPGLLGALVLSGIAGVLYCLRPTWHGLVLLCVGIFFWLSGFLIYRIETHQDAAYCDTGYYDTADRDQRTIQHNVWTRDVRVIPERFQERGVPFATAHAIRDAIHACIRCNPEVKIIIFPESAVVDPQAMILFEQLWQQETWAQRVHVFVGSFSWQGAQYCNTVYWLYNRRVQRKIHKNHASPLTERMPFVGASCGLQRLFFCRSPEINPMVDIPREMCWFDELKLSGVPYICSELFFNNQPHDDHAATIIALCNDVWVSERGAQHMYRCAQFKALLWQRDIVYCTYRHHAFLRRQRLLGL